MCGCAARAEVNELRPGEDLIMSRLTMCFTAILIVNASAVGAQTPSQPTAPKKMTAPADAQKMKACQAEAARKNIKMSERSKFVMDCMTAKAK